MTEFSIDDRGNVAIFYEKDGSEWYKCATLNREAGPQNDVDSVTTWNGDDEVTEFAVKEGYGDEIEEAVKTWP